MHQFSFSATAVQNSALRSRSHNVERICSLGKLAIGGNRPNDISSEQATAHQYLLERNLIFKCQLPSEDQVSLERLGRTKQFHYCCNQRIENIFPRGSYMDHLNETKRRRKRKKYHRKKKFNLSSDGSCVKNCPSSNSKTIIDFPGEPRSIYCQQVFPVTLRVYDLTDGK